jgi:hypothetical protein
MQKIMRPVLSRISQNMNRKITRNLVQVAHNLSTNFPDNPNRSPHFSPAIPE